MAYNEKLAARVREIISLAHKNVKKRKCLEACALWLMIKCVLV